jgi:hypothetical protein
MSEPSSREAVQVEGVDVHPDAHRATAPDEEAVLRELYGEPDAEGIYRGDPPAPSGDGGES